MQTLSCMCVTDVVFAVMFAGHFAVCYVRAMVTRTTSSIYLQGHVRHNWRTRWFVLMRKELSYFKKKEDRLPAGIIPLVGAALACPPPEDTKKLVGARQLHIVIIVYCARQKCSRFFFTTTSPKPKGNVMFFPSSLYPYPYSFTVASSPLITIIADN